MDARRRKASRDSLKLAANNLLVAVVLEVEVGETGESDEIWEEGKEIKLLAVIGDGVIELFITDISAADGREIRRGEVLAFGFTLDPDIVGSLFA